MEQSTTPAPKPEFVRISDNIVFSALDLNTAFGIEPTFKSLCIHFEPSLQAHITILEDKYSKPLTEESLLQLTKETSILPDDFIQIVSNYIDDKHAGQSLMVRSISAFHYLGTVSQVMMENCQRMYYNNMQRIKQGGIDTTPGKIITSL